MFITAKEARNFGTFSEEQLETMYKSELEKLEASLIQEAKRGEREIKIKPSEYGFSGKMVLASLEAYLSNKGYGTLKIYANDECFIMYICW